MADWIKMRSSLLTNPKVIRMARVLLQNPEFMEWMCPGRPCVTSDARVTKRDIEVVTRIVVGALLPTWSAVNDTAGRDGVIRHATSQDIDDSAGVPGFGAALMAVDWLEELPDGEGVRFVNFEEHNSPQKERSLTSKSGAERTKEWRERKRQAAKEDPGCDTLRDAERDDDVTSQRDDREEKKREEKNSSSLRSEEAGAGKPRSSRPKREDVTLAAYLETCRSEGRKPLPPDHFIRTWCGEAGIGDEMLQIAWIVFKRKYTEDAKAKRKRYADWPGTFANAVREGWLKLWYVDTPTGEVRYTSTGLIEKQSLDARNRARETTGEHA